MLTPAELGLAVVDEEAGRLVEQRIASAGVCGQPWLDSALAPLLARPGKRLRPALVFAAAACGSNQDFRALVDCAASVELMHLSSLIHDDLMDSAAMRSGMPTLHVSIGPDAAVLGGDHLFAVGGSLAAGVSQQAALAWHRGYADLCAGQIRETANRYRVDTTVGEYLAAINGKTAALMRTSCELGALCGGLDDSVVAALGRFGEAFGMVFQLVDDVMDIVSTEQLWRKPVQQDLANGVYSACVLMALGRPDSELHHLLAGDMSAEAIDRANRCAAAEGMRETLSLLERHVRMAETALDALPCSAASAHLLAAPRRYVAGVLERSVAPEHRELIRSSQRTTLISA
ncbi:geranylgeranyl pyrophosphate synthase [Lentzea flava]|uniref:Geranylgeranyl pyrophosphate synthase n=2 Tax=Lentzea flava TaxID=103732 RepID=A0ABQ2VGC1_9PSEU|nr:heptaprenyl diphosphate synthase [Lentzea flava]GGU83054.1 geranylgeranyl pyrophosphate synthase [Lentzea flava]